MISLQRESLPHQWGNSELKDNYSCSILGPTKHSQEDE
jgi:hypothetical protein